VEDCSPYLAEMDAKIAAAAEAGHDVSMARQIRESLVQACPFMDDASLRRMVDGLDGMFPAMSEFADMQGRNPAEVPEKPQPASAEPRPPAPATSLAAIGRTLGGRLIDRPDDMHQFGIWDMDLHAGRARVLYHTRPDRLQFAGPDWEFVVYAVTTDAAGHAEQRLITRRQASDHAALALRRGTDEVLLQRQGSADGSDAHVERWSIPAATLLGRVPVPAPGWPDGSRRYWGAFAGPTTDGNLFFAGLVPEDRNSTAHTVAWFKASPEGQVLGQGSLTRPDRLAPEPTIGANGGRGAVMLTVMADTDAGIDTRLEVPIHREVGGRKLLATVGMEKRILLVGGDGRAFVESPALERMLTWQGEMGIPQTLPMAEMMRQNQLQMTTVAEVDRAVGADRRVVSADVGLKRLDMAAPMAGDHYAVLVDVTADRDLQPPRHGAYLLDAGPEQITERLYLEPLAEALDARFTLLTVSPSDQVYLYAQSGNRQSDRVIRVGASGQVEGYAAVDAAMGITVEGLVADGDGVWVFGRGFLAGKVGDRIWVERVVFGR